jgi:hypothetical protein
MEFYELVSGGFDLRDVISLYEELELDESRQEEVKEIQTFLEEVKGSGGDEQWRGDWYPLQFIADDKFEEAMDDLVESCVHLPELPSFVSIKIDYDALQSDYSSVEINGDTYWYR